jgi:multidrug efflux pump subunit AcrA (membrane-fusion protein)
LSAITEALRPPGRPLTRLRRARLAITLALLAAVAVVGAVSTIGSPATAAPPTSRTVTVKSGVIQSTVSGSGNLEPATQQDLSFTNAGTVTKVAVQAGDHVTDGQLLATLDPTDTTQATEHLRAPYTGTIATVGVQVGDVVGGATSSGASSSTSSSSSSTPAFEVVKLNRYEMSVSLTESDIGKVSKGQLATVTVSATGEKLAAKVVDVGVLSSSDTSSTTSTGTASSSSSSSSSGAVSYPVTLRLTQTGSKLKPGMSATADIVTAQTTGLTVPSQALHGSTVTVVAGGKQTPTQVQTGVTGDSTTEITSGLKAGDQVLVTSQAATAGASATTATGQATGTGNRPAGGFGGGAGPMGGGAGMGGGGVRPGGAVGG